MATMLAHEYGYLDNKHNMGFHPRPHGFEKNYEQGWAEWQQAPTPGEYGNSYADPINWGWY